MVILARRTFCEWSAYQDPHLVSVKLNSAVCRRPPYYQKLRSRKVCLQLFLKLSLCAAFRELQKKKTLKTVCSFCLFAGTWECAHAVEQSSALPQAGVAALLVEHGADSLALDGSGLSGSFLFFLPVSSS